MIESRYRGFCGEKQLERIRRRIAGGRGGGDDDERTGADVHTAAVRARSLGAELRSAKNCWHVKPDSARGVTTELIGFRDAKEMVSGEGVVREGKWT